MFIIYVTLATKILNRHLIFPKNVINETFYLPSAKMHHKHLYKFKLIPIEFTSLKKRNILLLIYLTMATVTKWSATVLKSILEDCDIFFSKATYKHYFQFQNDRHLFSAYGK